MKQFINQLETQISLILLNLRSKAGFLFLLSLMRIIVAALIIIRVNYISDFRLSYSGLYILIMLYPIYSIIISIFTYRQKIDVVSQSHQSILSLIDTAVISLTITAPDITTSDFYLLYFLPLIGTTHYLQTKKAILFNLITIFSFLSAIIFSHLQSPLSSSVTAYWLTRTSFLSTIMVIYRIQRRLPQPHENSPKSPVDLRKSLEERLKELAERIHCKTISLQLLHRNRFVIVATYGYPKSKDVRKIEFPADDPRYPNYLVASTKKPVITNANNYLHFSDPIYHATHITTWMGIPLISPITNEFLGMISIDYSTEPYQYKVGHEEIATQVAKFIATEITEAQLGSASLTMTTKRELISNKIKMAESAFAKFLTAEQSSEAKFSEFVTLLGKELFDVEDCSLYLVRKNSTLDSKKQVLHLIASSTIPKHTFTNYECKIAISPKIGLTGYTLASNQLLNLGHNDIFNSPFHNGTYNEHLSYLHSKRSRQIIITPLLGIGKNQIGVMKLENKLGWISDDPFPYMDEKLFGIFSIIVSLCLEQIRLRNSTSRWRKQIHDTKGDLRVGVIQEIYNINKNINQTQNALSATNHVASMLEGILMDTEYSHALESYGILYAIKEFIDKYTYDVPSLLRISKRFHIYKPEVRDELPFQTREIFYNIACEAIRNIIHHCMVNDSKSKAAIKLKYYRSQFVLLIVDSGNGFELDFEKRLKDPHHFGIRYMDEEARRGNAKIQIRSSLKYGTMIRVIWLSKDKE